MMVMNISDLVCEIISALTTDVCCICKNLLLVITFARSVLNVHCCARATRLYDVILHKACVSQ